MELGSLIKERYRISGVLGKGGMGAVYRAIDETLGVQVALKENLFEEEEYVRQFRREASILANLRHPNLPRVTDHFVIEGQGQYLVMDFIEGEDLKERIDRLGVLPVGEAVLIGTAICEALTYLHDRPQAILHRDIKPGNVKITSNGEVYLVDFGLAKIVTGRGQTTVGAQAITPGFSPPEQYGASPTTPQSDIYSLAATLYEAVVGTPPENALDRMMDPNTHSDVRDNNPTLPEEFAEILNRALEIHPEDRYASASDFRLALLAIDETVQPKGDAGDALVEPIGMSDTTMPRKEAANEAHPAVQKAKVEMKRGSPPSIKVLSTAVIAVMVGFAAWYLLPLIGGGSGVSAVTPDSRSTQAIASGADGDQTPEDEQKTPIPDLTTNVPPTDQPPTPAATSAPTPVGGGNGQIAFASDRTGIPQIWIINADGSGLHQVTDISSGACQPDWSPEGQQLVIVSPCPRNQDTYPGSSLFLINADGSGLNPLPAFPGGDFDPAWSPDGSKIAFTSLRDGGREQIWIMDLSTNETTNLSDSVAKDFQPVWSPDGQTIMFVTTRSGREQLWFMDVSGRPWDFFTRSEDFNNRDPLWSPDGEVILFTQSRPAGGASWISSSAWEGGGVLRGFDESFVLGDDSMRSKNPMREADISPDGLWLAMMNNPGGANRDIYIMTTRGTSLIRLTEDPGVDFDATWNPAIWTH